MSNENDVSRISSQGEAGAVGPFLARVISHLDPTYMGMLEVELLRPSGNTNSEGQLHQVKYMSPFYGVTSVNHTTENNDYNGTQKSYGMWMIPPDTGSTVVVFFIDGDPKRGYWMGCVQDEEMNFMVPGLAATEFHLDGKSKRVPTAEYNKKATQTVPADTTRAPKPAHPLATVLETQGLLKDDIRGITTSSARRETPSMVFGISTPGPVDKRPNAQRGGVGKKEHRVKDAFVSRLGGTTFVMDDGDANFLRKAKASEAGPEYAAAEQGEKGGQPDIPHNELFRIRTRTGHQILLHNSEDLIYIGNARGTTWVELTSNGKIDIYAQDSISVHTNQDLNFTADRDINLTAGANINLNATGNANITATGNTNINSANHVETAGTINMNGPTAARAARAARVPKMEPWKGHENLNPQAHTPARTRAAATVPAEATPPKWSQYTTVTDTFAKVKGAEKK